MPHQPVRSLITGDYIYCAPNTINVNGERGSIKVEGGTTNAIENEVCLNISSHIDSRRSVSTELVQERTVYHKCRKTKT
jgi:hypothetical protein